MTGATQETLTVVPDAMPDTAVGTPGTVAGTRTLADAVDAAPGPTPFAATTVNVYVTPRVSPATAQAVEPVVVQKSPPGDEVAVYPVIADPPSLTGATHVTFTLVPDATPDTPVGASGTVGGTGTVTALLGAEASESPKAFVAITVNV